MTRLDLVILFVEDLERAARFYREGLGWRARVEAPRYIELDGGVGLMVREAAAAFAGPERAARPFPQGTLRAELYLAVKEAGPVLARLEAMGGVSVSPLALRPWGDTVGYVADPDGHLVAVAERGAVKVRPEDLEPVAPGDPRAAALLQARWGKTEIVLDGRRVDAAELPGFALVEAGALVGLVTYQDHDDVREVITLDALDAGRGIGRALMAKVEAAGRPVRVVTTNDNLPALGFCQRVGYRVVAVRVGAVDRSRALDRRIPTHGHGGLPITDEWVLERVGVQ